MRGSVRLMAVVVSKHEDLQAADLQPSDYQAWRQLRMQLQYRKARSSQAVTGCEEKSTVLLAVRKGIPLWMPLHCTTSAEK